MAAKYTAILTKVLPQKRKSVRDKTDRYDG